MILTLTPNPAVDITWHVDQLTPGTTHRVPPAVARAGGKGLNVARVLHAYCYMKGLTPWRSLSFLASLVGNVLLAIPLVPHIWS